MTDNLFSQCYYIVELLIARRTLRLIMLSSEKIKDSFTFIYPDIMYDSKTHILLVRAKRSTFLERPQSVCFYN